MRRFGGCSFSRQYDAVAMVSHRTGAGRNGLLVLLVMKMRLNAFLALLIAALFVGADRANHY